MDMLDRGRRSRMSCRLQVTMVKGWTIGRHEPVPADVVGVTRGCGDFDLPPV
ncbi:hypothetical protein BJY19_001246 [Arthrobacter cupressi]|nr:hypothetical protein [Arthrobacter cupressi]